MENLNFIKAIRVMREIMIKSSNTTLVLFDITENVSLQDFTQRLTLIPCAEHRQPFLAANRVPQRWRRSSMQSDL